MHHVEGRLWFGLHQRARWQWTHDLVVGGRRVIDKNTKARLDAELLYNCFAGIAGHGRERLRPAAAAPVRHPDRDADAACRPAALRKRAASSAPAPTRGSASCL